MDEAVPSWYQTYAELTGRIQQHIHHVKLATIRLDLLHPDRIGKLSLQADTVVALTALMNMHSVLANVLNHEDSRRQAVNTAVEIISISVTFADEDYAFLDTPLSVSILVFVVAFFSHVGVC